VRAQQVAFLVTGQRSRTDQAPVAYTSVDGAGHTSFVARLHAPSGQRIGWVNLDSYSYEDGPTPPTVSVAVGR
jgi:hypothetical protein